MSKDGKPSKNEGIKERSEYLRGTIAEGMQDLSTGGLFADDQQLVKFHGFYQQDDRDLRSQRKKHKLEKAFSFMIRIRVPGGVATPQQWLEIDRLASDYANDAVKLTTRQAFQLHGVIKSNMPRTLKAINEVALDSIAACGDVNRNVMCNVNPDQSSLHADVLKTAQVISDHLTPRTGAYHELWLDGEKVESSEAEEEPIYGKLYLPRKFKIALAIPPRNDVDVYANDLAFIAVANGDGLEGYNVAVGGGMGMHHGQEATYPRVATVIGFVPADKAVEVAEKVVLVQRDHGDRSNRRHARLKYTIDDHGVDWFREQVEERLGYRLEEAREFSFSDNGDRYGWTENEDGSSNYTFYIPSGRVRDLGESKQRTGFREIAKIVEGGEFRLTGNQNLTIAKIAPEKRSMVEALIEQHGLGWHDGLTGLRLHALSCVALPTCGLALAESERYLPEVLEELEEAIEDAGLREDAITIRMTGCPNGCARPYIAEIGFVGRAPGKYNIYLGGGFTGDRLGKLWRGSVKSEEIKELLAPVIRDYAKNREEGERFGDFVIRERYVKATSNGQDFHTDVVLPEPATK